MPRFKLWMTEDGIPHGPYGKKATRACNGSVVLSATDEANIEHHVSLAQMMALAWLPPRPPNSKLVHLDGDMANNSASNLSWAPKKTHAQRHADWKRKLAAQLARDPNHPRHGTMTGWRAGCKCTECANAGKAYWRRLETMKTIREVERICGRTTH